MARSNSPLRSFRVKHTGIGCLVDRSVIGINQGKLLPSHFFASNHLLPKIPGNNGTTRSSARNIPFSFSNIRRASKGLNLPLSFVIPITREINLIPFDSIRSLYSRWGSFVIRHIEDVRGSTREWTIGLGRR